MPNYIYEWDLDTGGYLLVPSASLVRKEIRPVFYEELDLFGLDEYWQYPKVKEPLLWAEGARRYFYEGELVAEAQGGGFFTKPTFKIHKSGLRLNPVDVQQMVEKNKGLMEGFVQVSLEFIDKTFRKYRKKNYDQFVVAFSGGKDSLVLLDLVQRALPPQDYIVIFGDTGMELSSTYNALELAQQRWKELKFKVVRSRKGPQVTWQEFGPPSRIHRWCCSVHKSVPTLLYLRTEKESINILVFDGIRREESDARSGYLEITEKGKHNNQVNASPILMWNSAELFLYIFERELLLNEAYRYGINRVGCTVCPLSSTWRDYIGNRIYNTDVKKLLCYVERYAKRTGIATVDLERYIESGGWKSRGGGKGLENGGNLVLEQIENDSIVFYIRSPKMDWLECSKILGNTILQHDGYGEQEINGCYYPFNIKNFNEGIRVEFLRFNQMDRMVVCYLRAIANKVAYCVGCQTCQVECSHDAFHVDEKGIFINEKCEHCYHCLTYKDKGCLAARSLSITLGGKSMDLKGMNRYQTFGLRKDWLASFFSKDNEFWVSGNLGNRQYDAMRVWLCEAGITSNNKITLLGLKMKKVGFQSLTWAAIWTNLAYHSTIVRWYVTKVPVGAVNTKDDLIAQLGEEYSRKTRKNAIDALVGLFRYTPLGNDLGFGVLEMAGNNVKSIEKAGWSEPDALAVIYALYRYAEKMDGHYRFTMSELENRREEIVGIDPMTLFGTNRQQIERILRGLAETYPELIKVDFMRDLDSIYLNRDKRSEDVFDLL